MTSDALTPIGGGDRDRPPLDGEGLGDGGAEPFGDGLGLVGLGVDAEDDELVAAEPRAHVLRAQEGGEALRELLEELVADGVAVPVVDGLEAVEVDEEQAAGADLADEGVVDALGEQGAVGQAGERVVVGAVQELGLEAPCGRRCPRRA